MSLFEGSEREVQDGETQPFRYPESGTRDSEIQEHRTGSQRLAHQHTSYVASDSRALIRLPDSIEIDTTTQDISSRDEPNSRRLSALRNVLPLNELAIPPPTDQLSASVSTNNLPAAPGPRVIPDHISPSRSFSILLPPREAPPVATSHPEGAQIGSILREIEDMWEAIARRRQAHLERTVVPTPFSQRISTGSAPPDYASVGDDLEDGRSTPRMDRVTTQPF